MATTTYPVAGITCGHCVQAVTRHVGGSAGVSGVTADLVPEGVSLVTATSDGPLAEGAVTRALDEADGYLIAGG